MKFIEKGTSPEAFEAWKKQENPQNWDNDFPSSPVKYPEEGIFYYSKSELRTVLMREQGGICCYCMQKIENDHKVVVEHLAPKGNEKYKHLTFDYQNLLLCCNGKERKDTPSVTPAFCGHKKGDIEISITPLQVDCETHFTYYWLGDNKVEIVGLTAAAEETIKVLGLNVEKLKSLRGSVLVDENGNLLEESAIKTQLAEYERQLLSKENDTFRPFCMAEIIVLKRLLGIL